MALALAFEDRKREILRDVYGFEDFRPGQEDVVDSLLAGRHALAVMPTGSGKSLCFQVPALALGGITVVVSPLVALMQDQVSALRLAGVQAETINSARDRSQNVDSWRRVASGEAPILYLAPERLMTERMLSALSRLPIKLIAIPSRRHSSVILSSPRSPSNTIRILSSAEYCFRVARRISLTTRSAGALQRTGCIRLS